VLEKVSWTDRVEERKDYTEPRRGEATWVNRKKAKWIGHIWHRNCLLEHITKGKRGGGIAVTGSRRRRSKQILAEFKEKRGYCKLKEEALNCTV